MIKTNQNRVSQQRSAATRLPHCAEPNSSLPVRALRSPALPFTYVTTPVLLSFWGLQTIRDLPDMDKLEEASLLSKAPLREELRSIFGWEGGVDDERGIDVHAERLDAT